MNILFDKDFISFNKHRYGEIDTILSNNISLIVNNTLMTIETIIGNPIFVLLSLTYIISLSPYLILFVIGEIILMFFATRFYAPRFEKKYENQLEAEGLYSNHLEKTYNSFEDYRISFFSYKGLRNIFVFFQNLKNKNIEYEKLDMISSTVYNIIQLIFDAGALLYSIYLIKNDFMTVGDYIAFIGIKPAFVGAFNGFSKLHVNFGQLKIAIDKIWEIIPYDQFYASVESKKKLNIPITNVKFQDVSFSYDKKQKIFENFNYEFKIGKTYLIYGANGSGKTSLIRLLTNLCIPTKGKILFNNAVELNNYSEESISNHIKVLSQHPQLIDDSLKNNISFNVNNFMEQYKVLDDILALNSILAGYESIDTNIFSGGKALSGGQIKKICLGRTLFGNSDVLILDEPMAALDKNTQTKLYEYLKEISKNKIIIIITHDHSWNWNNNEIKLLLEDYIFEYKK